MNQFNLLKSIPLIVAACFLFSLILGLTLLWPRFQDFNAIKRQVEQKREELQSREDYFLKLSEIKTKLEDYETEISKINSALPDDPSLPSLLNFIQKASSQSGLVLKGISPFTVVVLEDKPEIKKTQFSIQVTGSYSSFKKFLTAIENSARMIEVENISFSYPQEGREYTFNLRIKVYSY